jgi:hypothetical protein
VRAESERSSRGPARVSRRRESVWRVDRPASPEHQAASPVRLCRRRSRRASISADVLASARGQRACVRLRCAARRLRPTPAGLRAASRLNCAKRAASLAPGRAGARRVCVLSRHRGAQQALDLIGRVLYRPSRNHRRCLRSPRGGAIPPARELLSKKVFGATPRVVWCNPWTDVGLVVVGAARLRVPRVWWVRHACLDQFPRGRPHDADPPPPAFCMRWSPSRPKRGS